MQLGEGKGGGAGRWEGVQGDGRGCREMGGKGRGCREMGGIQEAKEQEELGDLIIIIKGERKGRRKKIVEREI